MKFRCDTRLEVITHFLTQISTWSNKTIAIALLHEMLLMLWMRLSSSGLWNTDLVGEKHLPFIRMLIKLCGTVRLSLQIANWYEFFAENLCSTYDALTNIVLNTNTGIFMCIYTYICIYIFFNFYICTVHLDTITVYYSPTYAQVIFLKAILKFTLT